MKLKANVKRFKDIRWKKCKIIILKILGQFNARITNCAQHIFKGCLMRGGGIVKMEVKIVMCANFVCEVWKIYAQKLTTLRGLSTSKRFSRKEIKIQTLTKKI